MLDLRIGYATLAAVFKDESDLLFDLCAAKKSLEEDFADVYVLKADATPVPAAQSAESSTQTPSAEDSPKKSFFSRVQAAELALNTQDELKRYFRLTSIPLPFKITDLLGWWYTNRALFPNLYKMARDIHCIPGACFLGYNFLLFLATYVQPGSAVAVERVFSGGRDTIALRRASLQPSTIRTLMVLKVQLRVAHKEVLDVLDEVDAIGLDSK